MRRYRIVNLLLTGDFPQIWAPSWENRELRQLLWHRHRMVQARTRVMNQLQAVALNEGLRCKKKLWRQHGREQLEAFRLAPLGKPATGGSAGVTGSAEHDHCRTDTSDRARSGEVHPVLRLMTHPGVGALTALAFVLIIGKAERF